MRATPTLQTDAMATEAKARMERAGLEAIDLGETARPVLKGNGPDEPRAWKQHELRAFASNLLADGKYPEEASLVSRYADARLRWGQAIEAYRLSMEATPPRTHQVKQHQGKPKRHGRKSDPTRGADGLQVYGWFGSGCPEPDPPGWHSVVPPWVDGCDLPY